MTSINIPSGPSVTEFSRTLLANLQTADSCLLPMVVSSFPNMKLVGTLIEWAWELTLFRSSGLKQSRKALALQVESHGTPEVINVLALPSELSDFACAKAPSKISRESCKYFRDRIRQGKPVRRYVLQSRFLCVLSLRWMRSTLRNREGALILIQRRNLGVHLRFSHWLRCQGLSCLRKQNLFPSRLASHPDTYRGVVEIAPITVKKY